MENPREHWWRAQETVLLHKQNMTFDTCMHRNMYLPFHFYGFEFVGRQKHVSTFFVVNLFWQLRSSESGERQTHQTTIYSHFVWMVIFNHKQSWKLYECNLFRMNSTTLNGFVHELLAQGHFRPNIDHHHHTSRVESLSLFFCAFVLCFTVVTAFSRYLVTSIWPVYFQFVAIYRLCHQLC